MEGLGKHGINQIHQILHPCFCCTSHVDQNNHVRFQGLRLGSTQTTRWKCRYLNTFVLRLNEVPAGEPLSSQEKAQETHASHLFPTGQVVAANSVHRQVGLVLASQGVNVTFTTFHLPPSTSRRPHH